MSKISSGVNNSQYGKPRTEEQKQRIKDAWKNKPKIQCPYCDVSSTNPTPMKKHHFDNCKHKPKE